jgi:hypothetical protein
MLGILQRIRPGWSRMLLSFALVAALHCGGGGGSSPTEPSGSSTRVTWTVTNECTNGTTIQLAFFDDDDGSQWPSDGSTYLLPAGATNSFELAPVTTGTQTCFGAETYPPGNTYWGVDIDDSASCSDCCNTTPDSGVGQFSVNLTGANGPGSTCKMVVKRGEPKRSRGIHRAPRATTPITQPRGDAHNGKR